MFIVPSLFLQICCMLLPGHYFGGCNAKKMLSFRVDMSVPIIFYGLPMILWGMILF